MPESASTLRRLWVTAPLLTALLLSTQVFAVVSTFGLFLPSAFAQESTAEPKPVSEPIEVSDEEAGLHLRRKVAPVYPPLAKTARIEGKVGLLLRVSPEGSVDVSVISGHPMLAQAAINAARQWQFDPFIREGHPVAADIKVEIVFSIGDASGQPISREQRLWEIHNNQEHICREHIEQRRYRKAETECTALATLAEELPPGYLGLRRQAYAYTGDAFWFQGKLPEARAWYQRELSTAEALEESEGYLSSRELAHAYYDAAHGSHGIGEFAQARFYYEEAEKIMEHERKQAESVLRRAERDKSAEADSRRDDAQSEKEYWRQTTESLLRDYAALLRDMGEIAAAKKAEHKAQSLGSASNTH